MKCSGTFAVLLAAIASIFPVMSSAGTQHGNDGSFCTFKGYLAYDDLEGITHSLRVIRFEAGRGVYLAEQVTLPRTLTVRSMSCEADRIELEGYDSVWRKCAIEIGGSPASVANCSDDHGFDFAKLVEPPSLGIFGPDAAPIPLESADPEHSYQLLRHLSHRVVAGGTEWHTKCEIVQIDRAGSILKRLVIYDNRSMEYAD